MFCLKIRRITMKSTLLTITLIILLSYVARAQNFNSSSTGADGALDLSSGDREVQLPESGVLNYTTVNIPAGRTLRFQKNSRNTPVIMLAQGAVTISGKLDVSALGNSDRLAGRDPGPGGFQGGDVGQQGLGPGGGASGGTNGQWVGALSLVPIIGGSGGGGYATSCCGCDGGGGGGAIVLASSSSISIASSGAIDTAGRPGRCSGLGDSQSSGSSGAVRIIANSIDVKGNISAAIARLEAPAESLFYSGSGVTPILARINPVIIPDANSPTLTIVSIGGFPVPSYSAARLGRIDLMLPRQLPDPISVVIQGRNIPAGTPIKISVSGAGSATTGTLGSDGKTTLQVSGLDKGGAVSYLYAYAIFDLPKSAQNFNLKGRDEIAQVRIEAAPGAKPRYIFLRKDGSEIAGPRIPTAILEQFGELEK
jgi:hypothetical protein